ncbi:MAG: NADH-quinone oxidoreductase subunit NuoK [Pirellulales bacterium]|nr:NADH-quinone oxidoreductase subunit NuoK [Pirellulales bacterium]
MANELAILQNLLFIGAVLFGLGLVGFLCRRNMIVMFLCAEMMLQGVSLSLVAWGRYHNDWGGQLLTIFILTVAACEAGIALALVVMLYNASGKLDIAFWQKTREDNLPAFFDDELPELPPPSARWPRLTPAGIEPAQPEEEIAFRHHV